LPCTDFSRKTIIPQLVTTLKDSIKCPGVPPQSLLHASMQVPQYPVPSERHFQNSEENRDAHTHIRLLHGINNHYGFESEVIDHKAWRSGNSDTSPEFADYLESCQAKRTHA